MNKTDKGVFHNIMHKVSSGILWNVLDLIWTGNNEIQITESPLLIFNKTCEIVYGIQGKVHSWLYATMLYYGSI